MGINDKRAVSPLLSIATMETIMAFDEQTRWAAGACLENLLPTMSVSDCNSLSLQDLQNLRKVFATENENLRLAIADVWRNIGGKEELALVEKLTV